MSNQLHKSDPPPEGTTSAAAIFRVFPLRSRCRLGLAHRAAAAATATEAATVTAAVIASAAAAAGKTNMPHWKQGVGLGAGVREGQEREGLEECW